MIASIAPASPRAAVPWRPRQVWIDRQVVNSPITANVLSHLPDVPTAIIDGPPPVPVPTNQAALMTMAKKSLYLTAQKGHFVRACPGATSRNMQSQLCCGYMIVDLIYNCDYDCTYCYLQSYVNAPYLTVYANVEQLFDELGTFVQTHPQQLVRIGSGEFSDSLSLDPLTGFSRLLVPFVRQFPNVLFEFKTKSALVDDLLDLEPDGKVMVSWSINPEPVVQREEHKTASLAARLRAALRCRAAGYKIGLHFDPLLYYPGWEADYEPFVAQVFHTITARRGDVYEYGEPALSASPQGGGAGALSQEPFDVCRTRPRGRRQTAVLQAHTCRDVHENVDVDPALHRRDRALSLHGESRNLAKSLWARASLQRRCRAAYPGCGAAARPDRGPDDTPQ